MLTGGGMALLLDRISSGATSPQNATAATEAQFAFGNPDPNEDTLSVIASPFPRDLPDINLITARDVFAPSSSTREMMLGEDKVKTGIKIPDQSSTDNFEASHKLSGVLISGGISFAIIDGSWLQVGDEISGCTIQSIAGNKVTFNCTDGTATLSVATKK